MALPKVIGTETEFGITVLHKADFNPVHASSALINAYTRGAKIQWSFDEESPGRDIRGFGVEDGPGIDMEAGLVNSVLTNGARLYVDHAHPEYSTPECADPLAAALYDKAGEVIMAKAVSAAGALLSEGERLVVHKNNSDGKGNSYGAHENYLIARDLPFGDVVSHLTPFLVSRQIFTGSGKVGSENGRPEVDFQISQRADFFEEQVGLETTLKRPIINTRDEPHADPSRYRRLHVIIGDATMNEVQTYLKVGTAALVLNAIEDGALPEPIDLADPVEAVWGVSHDPKLERDFGTASGSMTALDIQWQYFEWLTKYARSVELDAVYEDVLSQWELILTDLERDPATTADRIDWTAKQRILEAYRERDGLAWDHPKLRLLDLQYHDVDPERGLYGRLAARQRVSRLFTDDDIERAVIEPPRDTRAYFRGQCMARYPGAVVAANWDSLVFDIGEETLKRVPMMEPLRGTEDHVGELLDASEDAAALLSALGGDDG
ncbi:MAG: depupylase/deamidase Dop [Acidimicrobiia bacterium]|nr:MAG: depupylase/deamidase Dop [Acidimicrobiia bacterium]